MRMSTILVYFLFFAEFSSCILFKRYKKSCLLTGSRQLILRMSLCYIQEIRIMDDFLQIVLISVAKKIIDFLVGCKQLLSPTGLDHRSHSFPAYRIGKYPHNPVDFVH